MTVHGMVLNVFKVLALSIIIMTFADVTWMAVDTITTVRRVNNVMDMAADEIRRNNCIPETAQELFRTQLQSIAERSNVATAITSNLSNGLTVNGTFYPSVSEDNVTDYGTLNHFAVNLDMRPHSIIFFQTGQEDGTFFKKSFLNYTMGFVQDAPGLRYLK